MPMVDTTTLCNFLKQSAESTGNSDENEFNFEAFCCDDFPDGHMDKFVPGDSVLQAIFNYSKALEVRKVSFTSNLGCSDDLILSNVLN